MNLIGLDFETSGTDPWGDAAPIQIGMAYGDKTFESLIGGWSFARYSSDFQWSKKSEEIHGFTQGEIAKAPRIHEVDVRAAVWCYNVGLRNRMWNITVGWNVAGFDRQFVTRHMPNLNRMLSYRTIDLNALVFALANGSVGDYKRIKSDSKDWAAVKLDVEERWHDALYDAKAAVLSYEYLTKQLHGQQAR